MYMWVTFRITQENMSDAPPLSGRALTTKQLGNLFRIVIILNIVLHHYAISKRKCPNAMNFSQTCGYWLSGDL